MKQQINKNSWAVITGASGGIGRALAHECAQDGYNVVLAGRGEQDLRKLAREIEKKHGVKNLVFSGDLSDEHTPKKLYQLTQQRKCNVEILINNAGFGDYGPFAKSQQVVATDMIAVNIAALTVLARLFGAYMVERKSGRIMNVASTAAFLPGPYMAVYYATKAYVLSLSQALSQEWQGSGVTATALCPGPTKTGFAKTSNASKAGIFSGKLPTAEEVARFGFVAMKRGRRVAVHGRRNKLATQLTRILPRRWQAAIVARVQRPLKD
ncbi:SDR family oxidoreductase [Candidatus Saccharibacteria bacterium]|nr:SDR family oxidoreductase [Candidatus Saccharibacteria bacterium]